MSETQSLDEFWAEIRASHAAAKAKADDQVAEMEAAGCTVTVRDRVTHTMVRVKCPDGIGSTATMTTTATSGYVEAVASAYTKWRKHVEGIGGAS